MATSTRTQHKIELEPGQFETLQSLAKELGYIQSRGLQAGKAGSVSALMQAIAAGEVIVMSKDNFLILQYPYIETLD